ncbi:MAG: type VI secretion system membrane subunit TssM [Bacillota bacterium]
MKKLNVLVAIVFVLMLALIFVGGSIFRFPFIFQGGLAILLLLISVILILFQKLNAIKKAGNIEQSISKPADGQLQNLSPEKRAEIELFKKQLDTAISSLKKSKIGKGKSGKSALYALPWYMIIGPSAAGKTTVIQNSGLEFPFSKDGFRGVGGTRNCDWFFSTRAIFLDTAGRYVTQSEDNAEWQAFLNTLKKNRKRQPVNGVLVALNIDEIINSDKNQLIEHSKNIRLRINELLENLSVNFPVYVVFTKCDLIQGFIEYFGDLSEIERSQIWGATFPFEPPDILSVKTAFDNEFELLLNKLYDIRTIRLSGPLKREQRRKVYLFPFQFKSLQPKLSFLVNEIFQSNPYQDNPIFRGFYFTSGTQEGIPLDIAIRDIAKQYNLPETGMEEYEEITETKNYFIKDLLNDVVINDQNYQLGQTSGYVKKNNFLKLAAAGGSLLFLILFLLLTFIGYNGSSKALDKISFSARSFANINWNSDPSVNIDRSIFDKADNLSSLIKNTKQRKLVESFTSFGMDKTDRFPGILEKLYFTKTAGFFTENIYKEFETSLRKFVAGGADKGGNTYSNLKSYLLLGSERQRLDSKNESFLSNMFTDILESRFNTSYMTASADPKDNSKQHLHNYSIFVSGYLKNTAVYPQQNDFSLISLVRSKMQYRPSPEELYSRLKQTGLHQFNNDLSFDQLIGPAMAHIVNAGVRIPYLYTADGWKNYVRNSVKNENLNSGREDWVMGNQKQTRQQTDIDDNDKTRREILLLYLNDFQQAWIQAIQSIRYGNFETVPLAAANMKILSDPVNSPLIIILKTFATQLQVITDLLPPNDTIKVKNASYSFSAQNNPLSLNDVSKYRNFTLNPDGSSISKDLNTIIAQYGLLSGLLEGIKGGQDLTKDYAVKVLSQKAVELPTALQTIESSLYNTSILKDLFVTPVRLTWRAILSDAQSFLNAAWKTKVADPFNKTLANSFPFKKSGIDAPVQDFKEFFKPKDGIIESFINNDLAGILNTERWKLNLWDGTGVNISKDAINALRKADEISSTLFNNGELNFSFRLKPQLPDSKIINNSKAMVDQISLSLNSVENNYKMGAPSWTDYSWPGDKGVPGAKMSVSIRGYGNFETRAYEGEWALLRLLNDGSISSGETPSQYRVSWNFQKENSFNVIITYLLNAESSRNPFRPDFFNSFRLPDKLD